MGLNKPTCVQASLDDTIDVELWKLSDNESYTFSLQQFQFFDIWKHRREYYNPFPLNSSECSLQRLAFKL